MDLKKMSLDELIEEFIEIQFEYEDSQEETSEDSRRCRRLGDLLDEIDAEILSRTGTRMMR